MTPFSLAEQEKIGPLVTAGLIMVSAILLFLCPPAAADLTASVDTSISISCELPGRIIEAGETAAFDLVVANRGVENVKKMWFESFDADKYGWEIRFMDGEDEVNRISLPPNGTKIITLMIETGSSTPKGEYAVRVHIGDGWYWVYVTISETHTGEKGTLELSIVDKDGERIKGAKVAIVRDADHVVIDQVMTSADGKIATDVESGDYTLKVSREGYRQAEMKDIRIKGGITTDAGTIMLEKALFAAEITVRSPVITTTAGTNPVYEMTIRNIGRSDDTFGFDTGAVPQDWFIRFRETRDDSADIADLYIPAGEEKALVIEAIPPNGTVTGDFLFPIAIDSSGTSYPVNLTAKVRGSHDLRVYASQYQYSVNRGDPLDFTITLANAGTAGALTNVRTTVNTPDGWQAEIAPETIAAIPAGERGEVRIRVIPPANIVASEYKISVKVTSDQAEKDDDFRVIVKEQSLITVMGLLLLALLGSGVYYLFRKYSRR